MEQNKREQFIIRRIGGTTYKVRVAFSETAAETMEEKILRMIRNERVTNDGTCGIISPVPLAVSQSCLCADFPDSFLLSVLYVLWQ